MKFFTLLPLLLIAGQALANKPCEELKSEIAVKLESKGVKSYTLEVVPADEVGDKKVIGSCDGGARKIIYTRQ